MAEFRDYDPNDTASQLAPGDLATSRTAAQLQLIAERMGIWYLDAWNLDEPLGRQFAKIGFQISEQEALQADFLRCVFVPKLLAAALELQAGAPTHKLRPMIAGPFVDPGRSSINEG